MGHNFADPHDRATRRIRIAEAIAVAKGSIVQTAKALGVESWSLYKTLRRLDLQCYLAQVRAGEDAAALIAAMQVPPRKAKPANDVPVFAPPCERRQRDRMDCQSYLACLDIAARKDARWVCSRGCTRYQPAPVVLSVPVRSNWQIESAGVSNRRASEATEEDRREHVRSKEQRPLGSQVPMPWRLVG